MRPFWIALCCVSCAACATTRAAGTVVHEAPLPLVVTCHPAFKPKPEPPDTDVALRNAPDLFSRVRLLVAGRLERMARERELEAALRGCIEASRSSITP